MTRTLVVDGVVVVGARSVLAIDLTGDGVNELYADDGSQIVVNSSSTAFSVKDEGTVLTTTPTVINFTGAGVSASAVGTVVTVDIGGAGAITNQAEPVSRTLTATDSGVNLMPADAVVFTLPADLSPQPTIIFTMAPAGSFSVNASGGVVLNGIANNLLIRGSLNGVVTLTPNGTNSYYLSGI